MYDIFWKLIPGFGCSKVEKICLRSSHASSNKNEAIRAVLIFLNFFLRKDFAGKKSTKNTESTKGK